MSDTGFEPAITIFMLVKTTPEWLTLPVERRFEALRRDVEPLLAKHRGELRLRFYDTEFYSARVTDVLDVGGEAPPRL